MAPAGGVCTGFFLELLIARGFMVLGWGNLARLVTMESANGFAGAVP